MELLVVIGIIALLIGILMPALSKARAAANRTVCLSNIRQLGIGVLMYCNDNHGWFPTCAEYAGGGYFECPCDWIYWQANRNLDDSPIAKYVGHGDELKNLLRCPADNFDGRRAPPAVASGQGPYLYSYAMNFGLADNISPLPYQTKLSMWRSPWKKIMLTECMDQTATTYAGASWGIGDIVSRRHGRVVFQGNVPGDPQLSRGSLVGTNTSTFFLDGHAEGIEQDFGLDSLQIQIKPAAQ